MISSYFKILFWNGKFCELFALGDILWLLGSFLFCFYRNALPTPARDFAMIETAASHEDYPKHHLKKARKQNNKL